MTNTITTAKATTTTTIRTATKTVEQKSVLVIYELHIDVTIHSGCNKLWIVCGLSSVLER